MVNEQRSRDQGAPASPSGRREPDPQAVPALRASVPSAEHTPLPWEAMPPDEIDHFVPIIGVRLGDDSNPVYTPTNGVVAGAMLFPTEIDAKDFERAKANAAFIVRAVNCHYQLLEALALAVEILDEIDAYQKRPESGDWGAECACCMGELFDNGEREKIAKMRDAITNAGGI